MRGDDRMANTALVTGGAGFIGGHVVERLVTEKGFDVVAVDNFDPFYDPAVKREHWEEVTSGAPQGRRPELIEIDIRDQERLKRLFAERRFDIVVHAAARAGVRPSIDDPAGYMDSNVTGTARLYEACRRAGVRRVIFASSSSVYGDTSPAPFSERSASVPADFQMSPYAASKRAGELLTYTFSRLYGWRAISLRLFTVYGPWQRPDLAIHRFTRLLLTGDPLPVFGDGSMMRDHTYVSDIVDGFMRAVDWVLRENDPACETVNLGHNRPIRLDDLIAKIEAACGRKAAINRLPVPPGDVPVTCADLTHAGELLGYKPSVEFEEGLATFVRWCRDRLRSR